MKTEGQPCFNLMELGVSIKEAEHFEAVKTLWQHNHSLFLNLDSNLGPLWILKMLGKRQNRGRLPNNPFVTVLKNNFLFLRNEDS